MPARDIALVLLVCVAWALNFLISALALREIPPFLFTAVRFALLALPLAFFLKRPAPGQWPRLVAVALCVGVVHFGLSFSALKLAGDLSSPAIVMQSYVPMTALLAWWLLGERFAWRTGVAIAVSFAGVLVLGFDPLVLDQPMSLLLMLVSAAFLAIGTVLMKGLRGLDVFSQQGWTAVFSVLPLLAISAAVEPGALAQLPQVSWVAWAGALYAAFVSSLLGHGLYYVLVQRHPVAQVTPWLLLVPVLAVALGIAFWGDRPGPRLWLGGAMVLGGVLIIALRAIAKSRVIPASETP
ncbi:O-acetylserine/cysteine efflux transporter [Lysobacter niabensis]|uniref:O-acetylserine/cysteine efflux transporter n=1 Tax=Agrilutibacter niabensis TaxID=380628 RepID=A0ABU1VTU8_9GAMM|nr:DMT family transporter [Lysobacter niabensis]MDR7100785.1 O-acetylserine/cysteine efflux transporter [Lysobacter niabensis]